jgi:hypothetical protein
LKISILHEGMWLEKKAMKIHVHSIMYRRFDLGILVYVCELSIKAKKSRFTVHPNPIQCNQCNSSSTPSTQHQHHANLIAHPPTTESSNNSHPCISIIIIIPQPPYPTLKSEYSNALRTQSQASPSSSPVPQHPEHTQRAPPSKNSACAQPARA